MKKYVVLGSNSFSGASFVRHLLDSGNEVIGLSRSTEPSATFLPYRHSENISNFKFVAADINHNLATVMAVTDDVRPEYFVNFAAQSMVAESWANPEHWFMTNVVSTVKLHDELRKRKFLKRYVHVSTPEVYGSCSRDIDETMPFNPSTPYAVSRAAADFSLNSYFKNYGFPVVYTRAANVYGPGQQLYRIIPRTILFIKLGRKLQLHGGGHSIRSFIHIDDVAKATKLIAEKAPVGEAYHISTPLMISIRDLVQKICDRMNVAFEDAVEIVNDRPGKDSAYWLDSSKLSKTLGWTPSVDLDRGINETIRWVENNFSELSKLNHEYIHKA